MGLLAPERLDAHFDILALTDDQEQSSACERATLKRTAMRNKGVPLPMGLIFENQYFAIDGFNAVSFLPVPSSAVCWGG
jgi:hypothetical protein